jgi:hypothetical protein
MEYARSPFGYSLRPQPAYRAKAVLMSNFRHGTPERPSSPLYENHDPQRGYAARMNAESCFTWAREEKLSSALRLFFACGPLLSF